MRETPLGPSGDESSSEPTPVSRTKRTTPQCVLSAWKPHASYSISFAIRLESHALNFLNGVRIVVRSNLSVVSNTPSVKDLPHVELLILMSRLADVVRRERLEVQFSAYSSHALELRRVRAKATPRATD